jgi:ribonuclease BN (tRNA processing enzyme)
MSGSPFSITILGSGTCVPSLRRSACAAMMAVGDSRLLLDCGPGTMRRLLEAGFTIFEIDYLLFSHFHPDHTAELVPFLFATKYPDRSRRRNPLTVAAGRGLADFYGRLKAVYGDWIDIGPDLFTILELDNRGPDSQGFKDFQLDSAPVDHNPESVAYRVTAADGRSAVYSGDTAFSPALIDLARRADILICESALPDRLRAPGHMTPSLAGETAARAQVGRLVLTHFYPECDRADIEAECRKTYKGPLLLAEDLMRIEL